MVNTLTDESLPVWLIKPRRTKVHKERYENYKSCCRVVKLVGFLDHYDIYEHALLIPVTQLPKHMMRAWTMAQKRAIRRSIMIAAKALREGTSLVDTRYLGARLSILKTTMLFLNLLPFQMISLNAH